MNGDHARDLSDAVHLLAHLFLGGPAPAALAPCPGGGEAVQNGDANGDGALDVSDALRFLGWLFETGPEPVPACEEAIGLGGSALWTQVAYLKPPTSAPQIEPRLGTWSPAFTYPILVVKLGLVSTEVATAVTVYYDTDGDFDFTTGVEVSTVPTVQGTPVGGYATDGELLAIGEPGYDKLSNPKRYDIGAVHVFERSGTSWVWIATLTNRVAGQQLGHGVDMSENMIVATGLNSTAQAVIWKKQAASSWAALNSNNGATATSSLPECAGRCGTFAVAGGSSLVGDLTSGNPGILIREADNLILLGDQQAANGGQIRGAGFVLHDSDGNWGSGVVQTTLNFSNNVGTALDYDAIGDGMSLAKMPNGTFVVAFGGSQEDNDPPGDISAGGAVYVYERASFATGGTITETALLRASDNEPGLRFGRSVSLSDDGLSLFVGAFQGGSCSTTMTGGAVYTYDRGAGWTNTHTQKFQGSNTECLGTNAGDHFGRQVLLDPVSGLLAVGAALEDDPKANPPYTTGPASPTADSDAATNVGAIYFFRQ